MHTCTRCGCAWNDTGFYWYKGRVQQPCKECRLDKASIRYLNHSDAILEAQHKHYYANHEASKARFRAYRADVRASA